MTTKMIGIRSFRANMTKVLEEARTKNVHFLIMRFGEPIAHITPMKQKRRRLRTVEEVQADIAEARKQAARGEGYTAEEILARIDRRS